jgi:C-terminal processing protease CtpA/Prc
MQNLGGLDISTGDELIAVNKKRIQRDSLERMKTTFEDGEEIHLLISRRDKIMERKFTVKNIYNYKLDSIKYDNNPLGMYFFEGRN